MNWSLILKRNAETYPEKECLIGMGKRFTWSQVYDRVNSLAQGFLDLGLGKGDIIAILLNNCLEYIELTFAINQIGATWLPLNYRLSAPEFQYILDHAEAKALITEQEFIPTISSIKDKLPSLKHRIILDSNSQKGWSSYNDIIEKNYGSKPTHADVELDDLHRLMYTSGTTAYPKGVMLSYGNLYWKNIGLILTLGLTAADRTLVIAPLYHVGGMDACASVTLHCGGSLVILKRLDILEVLKNIDKEKVTNTWFAPSMSIRIFEEKTFDQYNFSSIRFIFSGGEKMPEALIVKFKEKLPNVWYADAYGLTETVSCDAILTKDKMLSKLGSVGRPVPHVSIRILDDNDKDVPPNELGEVCIKGPKVTKGYWKNPELTAETLRGGWLHTGDIGRLDEDGYLFIVDRKKDMVISGGENIASLEVERVIYELPEVLEVAVVGIPDPKWLEVPMAYIVLKEGSSLSPKDIIAHVSKKLAKFKIPKTFEFISVLPRNASGKVLKRELRAKYLRDHP
jgi:O-succinylbenzoate-CoA ligase